MSHVISLDKCIEKADHTGILVLTGRNLRQFPMSAQDLSDLQDTLEAGEWREESGWDGLVVIRECSTLCTRTLGPSVRVCTCAGMLCLIAFVALLAMHRVGH